MAADAWAESADDLARAGRLVTAAAGASELPPADAIAQGRAAAFAIYRLITRSGSA